MAWQDLTTLYRGQPWSGPSRYLQLANQGTPTIMGGSGTGLSAKELGRLAGQYWTQDADLAAHYAGNTGQIRSIKVPTNYIDKFNKFQKRVTSLPSGKYTLAEAAGGHLVPKSTLQKYPSKLNLGKTLVNYMSRKDYPGKLLKAGWDIMGEGYTVGDKIGELGKNITREGLAFLKNNAFRTLAMLGNLPAQVGIMALSPTHIGDVSDFESQENQRLRSLQNQVTSQANREARERVGRGEARDYGHTQTRSSSGWRSDPMWKGGIVDLYRYGGFI